jgi:hypothetical protein
LSNYLFVVVITNFWSRQKGITTRNPVELSDHPMILGAVLSLTVFFL